MCRCTRPTMYKVMYRPSGGFGASNSRSNCRPKTSTLASRHSWREWREERPRRGAPASSRRRRRRCMRSTWRTLTAVIIRKASTDSASPLRGGSHGGTPRLLNADCNSRRHTAIVGLTLLGRTSMITEIRSMQQLARVDNAKFPRALRARCMLLN